MWVCFPVWCVLRTAWNMFSSLTVHVDLSQTRNNDLPLVSECSSKLSFPRNQTHSTLPWSWNSKMASKVVRGDSLAAQSSCMLQLFESSRGLWATPLQESNCPMFVLQIVCRPIYQTETSCSNIDLRLKYQWPIFLHYNSLSYPTALRTLEEIMKKLRVVGS